MSVIIIRDISFTTFPFISPQPRPLDYLCYALLTFHPICHTLVHFCDVLLSMDRCTPQHVYCIRLYPWRFKLLSCRHGSTSEVGFIQVCAQNDASSTAHYNTLILSGLYRGGEEKEKYWGQRGQEWKCENKGTEEEDEVVEEEERGHGRKEDKDRFCVKDYRI